MKSCRFLHISDLHFFKSNHLKSSKEGISHFEIKEDILRYISSFIVEKEIGAILISGDLELGTSEDFLPYLIEWIAEGCKVFIVFGEHDTQEMRNELIEKTKNLSGLYIFEEPDKIEDEDLDFGVYGMSCASKQNGFKDAFKKLSKYDRLKPGIFLTHPCNMKEEEMKKLGCQYFAVGHIHRHISKNIGDNVCLGRPGHLYSVWDGDGKAWPVGGFVGEFRENHFHCDWIQFPCRQTVRIYIDPFKKAEGKGLFVIENCSKEKGERISTLIEGEWSDQGFRGIFKGCYDYENGDLQIVMKEILNIFIDDILVTPSDPVNMRKKYGYNRIVFTAATLLNDSDLFGEYMDRIFKASDKTQ